MKRYDKRRAGALAVLGTTLGAAALFFGIGAAEAQTPCTDSQSNDATLDAFGLATAGVSTGSGGSSPSWNNVWVCANPPGSSTELSLTDPNDATPGKVLFAKHCDSHVTGCTTLVNWTGAEVEPDVDTNAPLNGTTAGSGASAGVGGGTCVYVYNSTPVTCSGNATIGGVTVNEADHLIPTTHPNNGGGCVTVGSTCTPVPSGFGVNVLSGDSSNDTLTVTAGPVTESRDLGGCYGVNAGTGC